MNISYRTIPPILGLGLFALASPAQAQFYDRAIQQTVQSSAQSTDTHGLQGSLGVYPVAYFDKGSSNAGTTTVLGHTFAQEQSYNATGFLISGDAATRTGKGSFGFGGWIWRGYTGRSSSTTTEIGNPSNTATSHINKAPSYNLIDMHTKYFFTEHIGVQLGDRFPTDRSLAESTPYFYVLYNLPLQFSKDKAPKFGLQFGLGYYDNLSRTTARFDTATDGFSGFVAGSYSLTPKISLDGSYWYESGTGGFNRISIGIGIKL